MIYFCVIYNWQTWYIYWTALCGKVLAGWGTYNAGKYLGGFPPNFDKIIHKREEFKNFCKSLFKEEVHLSQKVMQFLTCNILRFYDDFLILSNNV